VSEKTKDDYIKRAFALGSDEERQRIIKLLEDELEHDWDDITVTRDAIIRSLIALIKGGQK